MVQPHEMKLSLLIHLANNIQSTTTEVWNVLVASRYGDINELKRLTRNFPELLYAQYNYTPPIYFAAREGHTALVKYLLDKGAHDPEYRTYPFLDSLQTVAADRNLGEIVEVLNDYALHPGRQKFRGDNGRIDFLRSEKQQAFEKAVYEEQLGHTELILRQFPEFAKDETYFWGEGIMSFAAKENNRTMIDLLMSYHAKVPAILKWAQYYYFEHPVGANYMMEKGMNPNTMSWHHVTILHDMAQKGDLRKAELLLKFGADINAIDEEYQSTPLGMAARWGHIEMVILLLNHGADPLRSGADWSVPLQWARKKGHEKIEKLLLERISSQNSL